MTTNVDDGAGARALDDAAAREVRRRLEEEQRSRAAQLAVLEKAVEQTPLEQVEASDYTRMDNLRHSLAEIDDALRRLEEGTYGRCEGCGQTIPAGRLEILPYVRYCVRCQGRGTR
ncbi:molecular chaperone DnaK [Actinomadura rubrobrunea]|uniref:Molecular chaperone DnaK n=1 Tax=Actinomadura rubrobrunea TaxID=115335 RepID=A0A9W6UXH2_9ACTN|nr:TraR/DksA C4-type zinc finger protein [Actinomadura rubrobrunea]GLW67666.1 molecular chaperone DnaK [Actinomadura rubrobrunea]